MTRPVRVLLVGGSLSGGGTERRLVDVLKHLDRRRFSPRLYLAYRRGELLPEVPADVPIDAFWDGVTTRSWGQRLLAKCRWPCGARAAHLREVLRKRPTDLIMSWSLMPTYEVDLATLGNPIPHVACIACLPKSELDLVFPRGFPFRRQLARWAYHSAAMVLANSIDLRKNAAEFYRLDAERTATQCDFRDFDRVERFCKEPAPLWPGAGQRIVAVGRLHAEKGFDILLEALATLRDRRPDFQLAILGQGPEEAALKDLAGRLGLTDRVHFLGFQPNPYVYLRSADLLVLASRNEGLPGVLIEALFCRTPVVATDCLTGPREILEDGRFGPLVPVNDVGGLAAAIGCVLDSPPADELRDLARQSMLDRYDIRNRIPNLENLLEQIASAAKNFR